MRRSRFGVMAALAAMSMPPDMFGVRGPRVDRPYVGRHDFEHERRTKEAAEAKRQRKAAKRLACRS